MSNPSNEHLCGTVGNITCNKYKKLQLLSCREKPKCIRITVSSLFYFLPHLTGEWFLLVAKDTHIDTVILYVK